MTTLLAKLLAVFGIGGKSLDTAIVMMTKLDAYLEQVEAAEDAKAKAASEAAIKANLDAEEATNKAARAKRIRSRAQDFVA